MVPKGGVSMMATLLGALPDALGAPLTGALVTIDARLVFAILWAIVALAVGAIVRSGLARREGGYSRRMRIVRIPRRSERRAA
jgi:hypothetical protein